MTGTTVNPAIGNRGRVSAVRDGVIPSTTGGSPGDYRSAPSSPIRSVNTEPCSQDRECLAAIYVETDGATWRTTVGWPDAAIESSPRRQEALEPRESGRMGSAKARGKSGGYLSPSMGGPLSPTRGFGVASSSQPLCGSNDQSPKAISSCGEKTARNGNGVEAKPTEAGVSVYEHKRPCSPSNPFTSTPVIERGPHSPSNPFAPSPAYIETAATVNAHRTRRSPLESNRPVPLAQHHSLAITTTGSRLPRSRSTSPSGHCSTMGAQSSNLARNRAGSALLGGSKGKRASSTGVERGVAWFGVSLGNAGRVTELKLVDNGLAGRIPDALGELEMLRYLHVGRNNLQGRLAHGGSNSLVARGKGVSVVYERMTWN